MICGRRMVGGAEDEYVGEGFICQTEHDAVTNIFIDEHVLHKGKDIDAGVVLGGRGAVGQGDLVGGCGGGLGVPSHGVFGPSGGDTLDEAGICGAGVD